MKLRVLKKGKEYIPQYYDEFSEFPQWSKCYLTNNLVSYSYYTLEEAKEICKKFEEKYKDEHGEVVWTNEKSC